MVFLPFQHLHSFWKINKTMHPAAAMVQCNLTFMARSIETESVSLCNYVNYHIAMLLLCGASSVCMTCMTFILIARYGSNPSQQQEDSIELCARWALATLILTLGFEGAFVVFYIVCFAAIGGTFAYIFFGELHQTAVRIARRVVSCRSSSAAVQALDATTDERVIIVIGSCPICLETDTGPWLTTSCGHTFHTLCLQRWHKQTCPMCRGGV
jgi:hypothetical protein